jgi:transposase
MPSADAAMLNFEGKRVYLACGHTDMRKSINGLAAIVEGSFKLDLFDGSMFVFCNRNRDRIKILEWDGDGFWLYFKRLERGRFRWPDSAESQTMTLSGNELHLLLGSPRVIQKIKRQEVKIGAVI